MKPALHLVPPAAAAAPKPDLIDTHTILPAGARNAMTNLEGKVNALKRVFSGPSTTIEQAARIAELTNAIQSEAAVIRRLAR